MRPTKVMRMLIILTAFCLLLGMAASASAALSPGIYINGTEVVAFGSGISQSGSYADGAYSAQALFDLDPGIGWSVNATNTSASDVNVTVIFGLFPTPGYPNGITVASTSGVTLTDGSGITGSSDGTASVQPFQIAGLPSNGGNIAENYTGFITDGDFTVVNQWGTDTGFSHNIFGGTDGQFFNMTGGFATGPNDLFLEIVSFTLSGQDQVGFSGNCSFVPIPPTALLFGSGMLGMALLGWRRKRQS